MENFVLYDRDRSRSGTGGFFIRWSCLLVSQGHIRMIGNAGWSSPVARQAHNLKVVGSNPAPATNVLKKYIAYEL
jgi:hypothetical protein